MADRLESAKYYDFLIRKIDHEDTLIHFRTQWSLTLQGFLFAAFSLVVASDEFSKSSSPGVAQEIMVDFLFLLTIAGVISAGFTSRGISAAVEALKLLKENWETTYDATERSLYPNPYLPSDRTGWAFSFAYSMPRYLTLVWAVLLAITVVYGGDHGSYALGAIGAIVMGLIEVIADLAKRSVSLIY